MNEIIAAIVGAVVTGLIALIAYIYTGRQGNRVIVKRISETPQIKISEEVRKNLKITYNDQSVDNLVLNNLVFYNNGNEIIEPLEIKLVVKSSNGELEYLESEEDDSLGQTKIERGGRGFVISRPYINPKKKFREEEIKLAVFSNTSLNFAVEGGGRGWYARFVDKTHRDKSYWAYFVITSIILLFAAYLVGASESQIVDNIASYIVIAATIVMIVFPFYIIYDVVRKAL